MTIYHGAASESAAAKHRVQLHLLRLEAGVLDDGVAVACLILRAGPDFSAVRTHIGHAIHGLHRGVRQIRKIVNGLEPLRGSTYCCRSVALLKRHDARFAGKLGVLFPLRTAVE